jgi:hypothetical protein
MVSIGADSFAGQAEDVVAAVRHYAHDPYARREIGGEDEHARLLRALGATAPYPHDAGLGPPAA